MTDFSQADDFVNQLVKSQRRLYAYILTLVPNLSDAEDVLQETNTVLLRKQAEFTPGTNFAAWACRVAYLEACGHFRRQSRGGTFPAGDSLLETLAAEAASRWNRQETLLDALGFCFEKLPARDQELIRLRYHESQSSEAISRRTGRTAGAVRQVLYRIRTDLLQCIRHRMAGEESA